MDVIIDKIYPNLMNYYLPQLSELLRNFDNNQNVAIIGHRRTGKSFLCHKFLNQITNNKIISMYIDIRENAAFGINGFSIYMLKSFIEAVLKSRNIQDENLILNIKSIPYNKEYIDSLKIKINDLSVSIVIDFFHQQITNKKINSYIFLEQVFDLLNNYSSKNKIKIVLILDEFQDILRLEKNMKRVINDNLILGFISGKIEKSKNVWVCITGSLINMMETILNNNEAAMYGRFSQLKLEPFSYSVSLDFINDILNGKQISGEAIKQLLSISNGIPYYIIKIIDKLSINEIDDIITVENVNQSFIKQLIEGDLNNHCRHILETINLFIKENNLQNILEFMAAAGKIKLKDLDNHFKFMTKKILNELRDLSVIEYSVVNKEKYVYLIDNLFILWLQSKSDDNELFVNNLKIRLKRNLEIENQKLKTELGKAIEFQYIHYIKQNADKRVENNLIIPKFTSIESKDFMDSEGFVFGHPSNIEIDAIGYGNEIWLFEFKNSEIPFSENKAEILLKISRFLIEKINLPIKKICVISLSGYTQKCFEQYRSQIILLHKKNILNFKKIDQSKILKIKPFELGISSKLSRAELYDEDK